MRRLSNSYLYPLRHGGYALSAVTAGQGVQVDITDGSIAADGSIFLYAPVFPVDSENSFEGKTLRFTIIVEDPTGRQNRANTSISHTNLKARLSRT